MASYIVLKKGLCSLHNIFFSFKMVNIAVPNACYAYVFLNLKCHLRLLPPVGAAERLSRKPARSLSDWYSYLSFLAGINDQARLFYCMLTLFFFVYLILSLLIWPTLFQFLVLDEADRVLDVGFQEELKFIFQCLPENRQNLFFSATTTSNLQKLLARYKDKLYVYEAYEGLKTVETLRQQVIFVPKKVKEVYLMYIFSKMEDMGIRSAIVFVSTCR